jgi:hypothetical protein
MAQILTAVDMRSRNVLEGLALPLKDVSFFIPSVPSGGGGGTRKATPTHPIGSDTEVGSGLRLGARRIFPGNDTAHPFAAQLLQQRLRVAIARMDHG